MRRRAPLEDRVIRALRAGQRPRDRDRSAGSSPASRLPVPEGAGNRATARAAQAGLTVGPVDDPLEREADASARRVTGGDVHRRWPGGVSPRAADPDSAGTALEQASRRRGRPLPAAVRRTMEQGLGADFADVRVHTGVGAAAASAALGAAAFTAGRDVFFGSGRYAPDSGPGRALIAHELTHAVQQAGGAAPAVQRSPETAVEDLVGTNPKINSIKKNTINDPRFAAKHSLAFPVTDETVAQVREALRKYREANPAPATGAVASYTGQMTVAEMRSVLTGNSGGQSYSPRGDKVPHWSVEWAPPAKGVYPIKQVHYKVDEGKYFWWNRVSGGKATFSDSTLPSQEHSALASKVNVAREKFAPRIHVDLDDIPAAKPRR